MILYRQTELNNILQNTSKKYTSYVPIKMFTTTKTLHLDRYSKKKPTWIRVILLKSEILFQKLKSL